MVAMRFFILIPLFLVFPLSAAQAATVSDENEWRLRDKASQEAQAKKLKNSTPPIQLPNLNSG